MRKLILKCGLSPGDVIMLTAAVRDLQHWYPGQFTTDVRTVCPELWENNPHITPIADDDPQAARIECSYPLINRCNETPYHCLHGFIEFLNERLHLAIKPTAFKGDIHLSKQEKVWYSQVHELTGEDTPFWIVAAGGKYDVTIKWWQTERYQEVVDHFRGKIQFVQVGQVGHHHPKLDGVIDLRGQTNLRQLIRLVYHAQGILCPVTALMHLAAAVETKRGQPANRPCVVIGGGREPAHWEAYPDHQFIHTNGALPCCAAGGCWRDRTFRLRDGDRRDRPGHRCVNVINGLPRCMDLISAQDVIRRITLFFQMGQLKYLSTHQRIAAERGVAASAENDYDQQTLNLHSAGMECDRFIRRIPAYPGGYEGRGIVVCGGGIRYFTCAWVCINMLRRLGCRLPIEFWHLGRREMNEQMKALLAPLGVQCVDAFRVRKKFPARILHGWELKPYAILYSSFREVLLLDADNVALVDPEFLFETPEFRNSGAIFWPDYAFANNRRVKAVWRSCGLPQPNQREFETGQILVNKERCWRGLCLTLWFNENSDFYYQHLHGDKETFHLAFRKLKQSYFLVRKPIQRLQDTMCQHDFQGRRIFQHRNTDKWDIFLNNKAVADFRFEEECRAYVRQLQRLWDGRIRGGPKHRVASRAHRRAIRGRVKIDAVMISCPARNELRQQTLGKLSRTDWQDSPLQVQIDDSEASDPRERQTRCAYLALNNSLKRRYDYLLFLEDDLDFNQHLRYNLANWKPLKTGTVTLASLYNPGIRETGFDLENNARLVAPNSIYGSQALLISRKAVRHVVRHWHKVPGMQDIKISRLAGRLKSPIYYHAPSLVQHVGTQSLWGAGFHQAKDFDPNWKA